MLSPPRVIPINHVTPVYKEIGYQNTSCLIHIIAQDSFFLASCIALLRILS